MTAEHVLLGKGSRGHRDENRDKLFLSIGLFKPLPPSALPPQGASQTDLARESAIPRIRREDFADLEEYHLRFLCRTNSVNMRKFLFAPRADSIEELLLPPQQLLPLTEKQKERCLHRFALRRRKARAAAAAAKETSRGFLANTKTASALASERPGGRQANVKRAVAAQIKKVQNSLRRAVPRAAWEIDDDQIAAAAVALAFDQVATATTEEDPRLVSAARCLSAEASRVASERPSVSSLQAATAVADRNGPWAAMAEGKAEAALSLEELLEEADKASAVRAFSSASYAPSHAKGSSAQTLREAETNSSLDGPEGSAAKSSAKEAPPQTPPPSISALLARRALGEALFVWCEHATEMKEFIERCPFLREGAYVSVFAAEALALDFYGVAQGLVPVHPRRLYKPDQKVRPLDKMGFVLAAPTEAARAHRIYEECDDDQVEWILKTKGKLQKNARAELDRPFYDDYLRDWAFIHLPEGEYISEPFEVSGDLDRGAVHEPSRTSAEQMNRDPNFARDYLPGLWLYKPESKLLYQDKASGALFIGSGIDGTFSWDKPVDKATMERAKVAIEMALENIRKGGGYYNAEMATPYSRKRGELKIHLTPEELAERKFTLEPFVKREVGLNDPVPTGTITRVKE